MIWVKFKLNKLSQVRSSSGRGGRERCQFISGRLKSPRSTSLMLPTQRYKTEVAMLWDVWGRDCGGKYTNNRGERGNIQFLLQYFCINICGGYMGEV